MHNMYNSGGTLGVTAQRAYTLGYMHNFNHNFGVFAQILSTLSGHVHAQEHRVCHWLPNSYIGYSKTAGWQEYQVKSLRTFSSHGPLTPCPQFQRPPITRIGPQASHSCWCSPSTSRISAACSRHHSGFPPPPSPPPPDHLSASQTRHGDGRIGSPSHCHPRPAVQDVI